MDDEWRANEEEEVEGEEEEEKGGVGEKEADPESPDCGQFKILRLDSASSHL